MCESIRNEKQLPINYRVRVDIEFETVFFAAYDFGEETVVLNAGRTFFACVKRFIPPVMDVHGLLSKSKNDSL